MDEKRVIKSVGVISLGKIFGLLSAFFGLIAGIFFAIISLTGDPGYGADAFAFGVGSIIIFPILYGIIGFIDGIIIAAIYNVIAGIVGGVEVEVETGY